MSEQESFDALTDIQKEQMLVAPEGDGGRLAIEAVMRVREHRLAERVALATERSARWSRPTMLWAALAAVGAVVAAVVAVLDFLAKR